MVGCRSRDAPASAGVAADDLFGQPHVLGQRDLASHRAKRSKSSRSQSMSRLAQLRLETGQAEQNSMGDERTRASRSESDNAAPTEVGDVRRSRTRLVSAASVARPEGLEPPTF